MFFSWHPFFSAQEEIAFQWSNFELQTQRQIWVVFVCSLHCSERFLPWHSHAVFPSYGKLPFPWSNFELQTQRQKWVELVCSLTLLRVFLPGCSVFCSHQKPTFDLT